MVSKTNNSKMVDLFDSEMVESTTNFTEKSPVRADGLYKPDLKKVIDKSKGYCATIRFLPNLKEDGTLGTGIIEKEVYYVKPYNKYFDIQKPFVAKCPLNTLQWRLKNSKNVAEQEKAGLLSYSKKFFSYVLIVEDEQQPELVGKILVFPFGFKIKEKIELQKSGENDEGEKCNVFDIVKGKEFRLIIKEVGGFQNYDSSFFRSVSPLKVWDSVKEKLVPISLSDKEVKTKVNDFLLSKTVKLEDNLPKRWTPEEEMQVSELVNELTSSNQRMSDRPSKKNDVVDIHEMGSIDDLMGDPDLDLDEDE